MTTMERKTTVLTPTARQSPEPSQSPASDHDHRALARAVEAAAGRVDANLLTAVAPADAGHAFQPRTLLAVLAFSYVRQIYASADIESFLRENRDFEMLRRDQLPDARILRRFRRENREALLVCLTAALRFLAQEKVAQGMVTHVNEAHVAEEASRRIIMAMFTDSMKMDKDQTSDVPADLCYLFANGRKQRH